MRSTRLGQRFGRADDARDQLLDFECRRQHVPRRRHRGDDERRRLIDALDGDAPQSLQRDLHRVAGQVDALVHAGGDTDLADELLRVRRVFQLATRDHQRDHDARFVKARAAAPGFPGLPICTAIVPSG